MSTKRVCTILYEYVVIFALVVLLFFIIATCLCCSRRKLKKIGKSTSKYNVYFEPDDDVVNFAPTTHAYLQLTDDDTFFQI